MSRSENDRLSRNESLSRSYLSMICELCWRERKVLLFVVVYNSRVALLISNRGMLRSIALDKRLQIKYSISTLAVYLLLCRLRMRDCSVQGHPKEGTVLETFHDFQSSTVKQALTENPGHRTRSSSNTWAMILELTKTFRY